MPFSYYARLSPARQRIYRQSDAIQRVNLPPGPLFDELLQHLETALRTENRGEAERLGQSLLNDLTTRLRVPRVRVRVLSC